MSRLFIELYLDESDEAEDQVIYIRTLSRHTRETSRLIERVRADARFGLAAIG